MLSVGKLEDVGSIGLDSTSVNERPTEKEFSNPVRAGHILDKKWDNGFYTNGQISGVECEFLIDNGSTITILSERKFNEITNDKRPTPEPFLTPILDASGGTIKTLGKINVSIDLNGHSFLQTVLVCDIGLDGIIGQDFLLKYAKEISYQKGEITTEHTNIRCWVGCDNAVSCRVLVRRTTVVPPNSAVWLPVDIENREKLTPAGLTEPSSFCDSLYGVVPGVVDTSKSDVQVNFVNLSTEQLTLYPKQTIASCEPYADVDSGKASIREIKHGEPTKPTELNDLPEHLTDLYHRSSDHLSNTEKIEFKSLLIEYQDIFAKSSEDLGKCDKVQHKIHTGNAIPVRQPARRQPIGKREAERAEVYKMLDKGVIEPSNSPWSSPTVLVTKKDGSIRFCVDYRVLNSVTVKDAYPLPRVDECLDALANSKFYSSMDLNSGFWQVGMAPEDRQKTAFATNLGLFQWTVMPFGLVNSPSTFQRLMEDIFRGLQWIELLLYMDDIISPCNNISEGIQRLRNIFDRLREANLKLKPSKCIFFQTSTKFLGHVVSEEGVSTDPEKISAVVEWPIPKSAKQIKSFLGLCSYYRRYVPGFAGIARPLHRICDKGSKFVWTDECDKAFQELKTALTTAPILAYPDPNLPYILDTDSSDKCAGGILSQKQNDQERVIAYMSKSLNKHEELYCTTRKELLAVILSLRTFHSYIYGQHTLLRTDNAAVSWLRQLKRPSGQIARWLQEVEIYDLTVIHRPGLRHSNADALSRRPCKVCQRQESLNAGDCDDDSNNEPKIVQETSEENVRVTEITCSNPDRSYIDNFDPESLRQAQETDPDIAPLLHAKQTNSERPKWDQVSNGTSVLKTLWRMWDRLKVEGGLLHRTYTNTDKGSDQTLLVVPSVKRDDLLHYFHDIPSSAHLGSDKMLYRLKQSFYWPGMKDAVSKYCSTCDQCVARKTSMKVKAPLQQFRVGEPMEKLALDIFGPLPVSESNNRYILVAVDCFTKWTEAYAIPNQETQTIVKVLVDEYICRFGTPMQILTDQGSNFTSSLFKEVCEFLHIDKVQTSSMRPQANGTAERFMRTLQAMLTMYCERNQKTWDRFLPQLLMGYRSSIHPSTGVSPNKMVFGHEIVMPIEAVVGKPIREDVITNVPDYIENLQDALVEVHDHARRCLHKVAEYQKRHYDLRAKKRSMREGQPVWLYNPNRRIGVCTKLTSKWKGPYLIVKQLDDVTYLVQMAPKAKPKVYHVDRLLPYHGKNPPKWKVGCVTGNQQKC